MNGGSCSDDHCICQKGYIGTHCGQRKYTIAVSILEVNPCIIDRHVGRYIGQKNTEINTMDFL